MSLTAGRHRLAMYIADLVEAPISSCAAAENEAPGSGRALPVPAGRAGGGGGGAMGPNLRRSAQAACPEPRSQGIGNGIGLIEE